MKKDTTFSIRIASEDLAVIRQKAKQARLSQSEYVTRCCLGRQIVVIDGLKEVLQQQRAIGNILNRLTILANMGRISAVDLERTAQELADISAALRSRGGGADSHHQFHQLPPGAEPRRHGRGHAVRQAGAEDPVGGPAVGQRL